MTTGTEVRLPFAALENDDLARLRAIGAAALRVFSGGREILASKITRSSGSWRDTSGSSSWPPVVLGQKRSL